MRAGGQFYRPAPPFTGSRPFPYRPRNASSSARPSASQPRPASSTERTFTWRMRLPVPSIRPSVFGQVSAVGELEVDRRTVRDDREAGGPSSIGRADRQQPVARIEPSTASGQRSRTATAQPLERPSATAQASTSQVPIERRARRSTVAGHRGRRGSRAGRRRRHDPVGRPAGEDRRDRSRPGRAALISAAEASAGDDDPVAQLAVDLDRDLAGRLRRPPRGRPRARLAYGSTPRARRPRPPADHSSSVTCGAAGASISSSSRIASSHSGPRPPPCRGSGTACSPAPSASRSSC